MQTQAEKDKSRKAGNPQPSSEHPTDAGALAERDEFRDTLGATATALARLLDSDFVKMPPEYRTECRRTLRKAQGVLEATSRQYPGGER